MNKELTYNERLKEQSLCGDKYSLKELKFNAASGNSEAQYFLAIYYAKVCGHLHDPDYLYWLKKSQENGYVPGVSKPIVHNDDYVAESRVTFKDIIKCYSYANKLWALISLCIMVISWLLSGCTYEKRNDEHGLSKCEQAFLGDSTAVFIFNEPQNGFNISLIFNKQLALVHFKRGDSISRYCAIHTLPDKLLDYAKDSIGVFKVDVEIPVICLDTLGGSKDTPGMFFMDMNFDGEEEFVIKHEGYNRFYYACFDLVKGYAYGACPGILEPINDPPYNGIVSGTKHQPSYTVFNYKDKTIYVYETIGCCSLYEIWAKCFESELSYIYPKVKVYKKVHHDWQTRGTEYREIYELQNDSLKLVKTIKIDY